MTSSSTADPSVILQSIFSEKEHTLHRYTCICTCRFIQTNAQVIMSTCGELVWNPQPSSQLKFSFLDFRPISREMQPHEERVTKETTAYTKDQLEILLIKPNAQSRRPVIYIYVHRCMNIFARERNLVRHVHRKWGTWDKLCGSIIK